MKQLIITTGLLLAVCSCSLSDQDRRILENENDSLKLVIQNLHQDFDSVSALLNSIKKEYGLDQKPEDKASQLMAQYKLELTRVRTGYVHSSYDQLFLPAVTLEFRNISNLDLNESIWLKFIFINNATGEQLYERSDLYCSSTNPLIGGLKKQTTMRSDVGWPAIGNQNISVRIYLNDDLFKTYKIKNDHHPGMLQ